MHIIYVYTSKRIISCRLWIYIYIFITKIKQNYHTRKYVLISMENWNNKTCPIINLYSENPLKTEIDDRARQQKRSCSGHSPFTFHYRNRGRKWTAVSTLLLDIPFTVYWEKREKCIWRTYYMQQYFLSIVTCESWEKFYFITYTNIYYWYAKHSNGNTECNNHKF